MKLTKGKIKQLADEIVEFLKEEDMVMSTCIYYNNRRINDGVLEKGRFDPHDYFEYAAYEHILSMSFEGSLYEVLTYSGGQRLDKFIEIFNKYGLYYERGNSWNLTAYPIDSDMEIEYTYYEVPKETIRIWDLYQRNVPEEILFIARKWRQYQEQIGDSGSCVLGAGFEFEYQDQPYFLTPCSRFQGSLSWEHNIKDIENMLKQLGATSVYYNWGVMD